MAACRRFWTVTVAVLVLWSARVESGPVARRWPAPTGDRLLSKRSPSIDDRPGCSEGAAAPPNRVNTTQRLADLRRQLTLYDVDAYIVTSDNAHQAEYVAPDDQRRHFVSGFTGSAGTAVVTATAAALWTDGRYFLQAEDELDCNWILMKQGQSGVPSISGWLTEVLQSDDTAAADPTLVGADTWLDWSRQLAPIAVQPLATNLIDQIWTTENGRPEPNKEPGYVHPLQYSGVAWQDKLEWLRAEMSKKQVDGVVVSALDEVAWLFNLRGSDVPYEPVLLAYALVTPSDAVLFAQSSKITADIEAHLNVSADCADQCVRIEPYDQFVTLLPDLVQPLTAVLVPQGYAYTGGSSFAVYNAVPASKRVTAVSPVMFLKSEKNAVEAAGMKNAHLKDAVALCDFLSQMDDEVARGEPWTELKASAVLLGYRLQQAASRGASFETIAGFAANGAIIHYSPSAQTDAAIDTSSLLLLDSGGQFLDGTTDVTRTLHFGQPTADQRTAYTRVLMGHVDMARLVVPRNVRDARIDLAARQPLYAAGLDFLHGTGHGIGSFLGVHESPTYVGIGGTEENPFKENYFFSDEPGYYKDGQYGIRIESILQVVAAQFDTEFGNNFFRFESVTLVPFEPKLIDVELLNKEQIEWINAYHSMIMERVGPELIAQKRMRAYNWLVNKTACIGPNCAAS